MRVIAIADDGVQQRAEDSHSEFDEQERFNPKADAVGQCADDSGRHDREYNQQPEIIQDSD